MVVNLLVDIRVKKSEKTVDGIFHRTLTYFSGKLSIYKFFYLLLYLHNKSAVLHLLVLEKPQITI
jgi:hypothetical protein